MVWENGEENFKDIEFNEFDRISFDYGVIQFTTQKSYLCCLFGLVKWLGNWPLFNTHQDSPEKKKQKPCGDFKCS